jgi:hypothetical protein
MPELPPADSEVSPPPAARAGVEAVFGVNEMRLCGRQWLAVLAIVLVCALLAPILWKRFEPFQPGPDYRLPYALSKDYWLYQRRLERLGDAQIPLLGDSVVWGEYVRPDGTLAHFLNKEAGAADHFVNCGVNGLFPLALEGLVADYGKSLRQRKVILQCNLLWLTSPKADLSTDKEEAFNHSRLVPQFAVRIPCYRASASERIGAVLERKIGFFAWTAHLQTAYYDQRSLPQWTLEDDGNQPPKYPNAWRNPLAPLRAGLPAEPAADSLRGPDSPRHKAWNAGGAEAAHFEWVPLEASLQWQAFQRLARLLRARENDLLVVLGPFNEHMVANDQRAEARALRDRAAAELGQEGVTAIVPETLPSELYADASHPLTNGYALLAARLAQDARFAKWLRTPALRPDSALGHSRP